MLEKICLRIINQHEYTGEYCQIDTEIQKNAFYFLENITKQQQREITEKYQLNPWKYIFANLGNIPLGRVMLDKRSLKYDNYKFVGVGINGLSVIDKYQRKGIGKAIINKAIQHCKEINIDLLFLDAGKDLQSYYKDLGFKPHKFYYKGLSGKDYLEEDGMVLFLSKESELNLKEKTFNIENGLLVSS